MTAALRERKRQGRTLPFRCAALLAAGLLPAAVVLDTSRPVDTARGPQGGDFFRLAPRLARGTRRLQRLIFIGAARGFRGACGFQRLVVVQCVPELLRAVSLLERLLLVRRPAGFRRAR